MVNPNLSRWKKLSPEIADECVRLYDQGMTINPLARYFGVRSRSMWCLLKRRTTVRPRPISIKEQGIKSHNHDRHVQYLMQCAIQKGIIERKHTCERCGVQNIKKRNGSSDIIAHHADYNKPLDVQWLCSRCHNEWHKKNEAIPLKS